MCGTCRLLGFHSSVQFIPNQLDGVQVWRLCWPLCVFKLTILFFFSWGRSGIAWTCVLGHYLAVGWSSDQLGAYQRALHGAAQCCGSRFGSGCRSLCTSHRPWIQQNSPRPSHFLLHVWQLMSHTVEPSSRLLDGVQRSCVMNRRFESLTHQSIIPSSSLQ